MTDYLKKTPTEKVTHDDVSITFPENTHYQEWLKPSLQQLTASLATSRYDNNKIPKTIREGQESLTDPTRLVQALTPPGKFLAENLTEHTSFQLEEIARDSLGSQSPLKFVIEVGSYNIFSAQQDIPVSSLFDHLFLRQVHDYLAVLGNYPHGLDLSFQFDPTGDRWVYEQTLGSDTIVRAQQTHMTKVEELIKTIFGESDYPRLNISTKPQDDLEYALRKFEAIEKVVRRAEDQFFSQNPDAQDWQFLWQNMRDPNNTPAINSDTTHTIFHENQDKFVAQFTREIDPNRKLGIFRATSRQLNNIARELRSRMNPLIIEDNPKGEFPHSGWFQPQVIIDLTRRFIARELFNNASVSNDPSVIHIRAGDPDIHKQFYRRPGIALKLSGTQTAVIPALEFPIIRIEQSKNTSLTTSHNPNTLSVPEAILSLSGQKYLLPIFS